MWRRRRTPPQTPPQTPPASRAGKPITPPKALGPSKTLDSVTSIMSEEAAVELSRIARARQALWHFLESGDAASLGSIDPVLLQSPPSPGTSLEDRLDTALIAGFFSQTPEDALQQAQKIATYLRDNGKAGFRKNFEFQKDRQNTHHVLCLHYVSAFIILGQHPNPNVLRALLENETTRAQFTRLDLWRLALTLAYWEQYEHLLVLLETNTLQTIAVPEGAPTQFDDETRQFSKSASQILEVWHIDDLCDAGGSETLANVLQFLEKVNHDDDFDAELIDAEGLRAYLNNCIVQKSHSSAAGAAAVLMPVATSDSTDCPTSEPGTLTEECQTPQQILFSWTETTSSTYRTAFERSLQRSNPTLDEVIILFKTLIESDAITSDKSLSFCVKQALEKARTLRMNISELLTHYSFSSPGGSPPQSRRTLQHCLVQACGQVQSGETLERQKALLRLFIKEGIQVSQVIVPETGNRQSVRGLALRVSPKRFFQDTRKARQELNNEQNIAKQFNDMVEEASGTRFTQSLQSSLSR